MVYFVGKITGLLVLSIIVAGCAHVLVERESFDLTAITKKLDKAVAESVYSSKEQIANIPDRNTVIYIQAPGQNFIYCNAAGLGRFDTGEAMTKEHQYYIASMTKSMTAAVIFQLLEEGMLGEKGLDSQIAEFGLFPDDIIEELHKIGGVSYGQEITIRHLLNHTSGMKDFIFDDENGVADDYPDSYGIAPNSVVGLFIFDSDKGLKPWLNCLGKGGAAGCKSEDYYFGSPDLAHWDPEAYREDPSNRMAGSFNFYLSGMNSTALFRPGEGFHYADTNYVILGLLIEYLTGNSLHHELRERIFEPLGMENAYMTYAKDPPAEQYALKVSEWWSLEQPGISLGMNTSWDWAAGGVAATAEGINTYIRALANGTLFREEATLDEFLTCPLPEFGDYAYGLHVRENPDGDRVIFHDGSFGSWMIYHFKYDVSIVGTVNELFTEREPKLIINIYNALNEAGIPVICPLGPN